MSLYNNKRKLVENIIRNLLERIKIKEDAKTGQTDGLAICLPEQGNNKGEIFAVLYDSNYVLKNLELIVEEVLYAMDSNNPYDPDDNIFMNKLIKGVIQIVKIDPRNGKCNNAWQVGAIAGPGYGPNFLYPIGFGLVPTGQLTPDRKTVKSRARNYWKITHDQDQRAANPLDDYTVQRTPPVEDDCKFHYTKNKIDPDTGEEIINSETGEPEEENVDQLNFSYEAEDEDVDFANELRNVHRSAMEQLYSMAQDMYDQGNLEHDQSGEIVEWMETLLGDWGVNFFRKYYDPEAD